MELNKKSLFREKCFVNGKWSDSKNGNTLEVNNPATFEIIGKVPNFSAEETKSAINHADEAFQSWKNTTAKERSIILKKWSDLIIENVTGFYFDRNDPFEKYINEIYLNEFCISPLKSLSLHVTNVNSSYGLSPFIDYQKLWDEN